MWGVRAEAQAYLGQSGSRFDADVAIGLRLPGKLVDAIDRFAKANALTRSEAIRTMVVQVLRAGRYWSAGR
jgi:hypothetical protein